MSEGPIIIHTPVAGLGDRAVRKRRPYLTLCGEYTKLPSSARVRKDEDGFYLVVGPHERYYARCEKCLLAGGEAPSQQVG